MVKCIDRNNLWARNIALELGGIENKINWNEFELNKNNKKFKRYNDNKKRLIYYMSHI